MITKHLNARCASFVAAALLLTLCAHAQSPTWTLNTDVDELHATTFEVFLPYGEFVTAIA